MPSLGTVASSLSLALLAVSTAHTTTTTKWAETNPTDADENLFFTALGDLNSYNRDITEFICAKNIESLYKKAPSSGSTKYNFIVNGCLVRSEYTGRCSDSYFYPECGNFDVLIFFKPKTKTLQVKSIKFHKVKSSPSKE
ncbi:hypothetical protein PHYPSEUDO_001295 [Phytophthora pseudosyringae]|uniref:Uncharacterized protein n=1 Tax=Phytophthora pseudosyringae TaxID=221518 RepID=A0A8T1W037_9STRA|nr:hypothetical protein PHYPSEUDO_001295 [Phytophthora pseudosyringae]